MPPNRTSNIGRRTFNAVICENVHYNQTQKERAKVNELRRAHISQVRAA